MDFPVQAFQTSARDDAFVKYLSATTLIIHTAVNVKPPWRTVIHVWRYIGLLPPPHSHISTDVSRNDQCRGMAQLV